MFCVAGIDAGTPTREVPMGSDYQADVQILEAELARVEQAFRGLNESDWRRPTLLRPLDETLPHWTLFELAGHLDISIGLTRMLISSQQDGQVGRGPGQLLHLLPRGARPDRLRLRLHHGGR
jgi:hypothetical protein